MTHKVLFRRDLTSDQEYIVERLIKNLFLTFPMAACEQLHAELTCLLSNDEKPAVTAKLDPTSFKFTGLVDEYTIEGTIYDDRDWLSVRADLQKIYDDGADGFFEPLDEPVATPGSR